MLKIIRQSRGSFLIEILLAITILSVVLTVVMRSFLTSLRATVFTADYSTALVLAENKLFDGKVSSSLAGVAQKGEFTDPYNKFSYDLKTEEFFLAAGSKTLDEVVLDVSWGGGKTNKTIQLTTLFFHPPLQ